jgi:hypothetical protein
MVNRVEAWFGGSYPDWIRYGVEYSYEKLKEMHELPPEVPYERHLFLFTVTFSWDVSTEEVEGPAEEPLDEGEEGIVVLDEAVFFAVRAPHAESVVLVGSFDGWSEQGRTFEGPDESGLWTLETDLEPGRHEVVYMIDGKAVTPPGAGPVTDDGFGGKNAVLVIP